MAVERPQEDIIATYSARFDIEVGMHPIGSETFVAARSALREKYGNRLGDGLFLAFLIPSGIGIEGDIDALNDALAEEIATRWEGTHEDRVTATRAILEMHRRTIQAMSNRH